MYKALATANRHLAELKGRAAAIPNQGMFIDTLTLQEAKASSEIVNIVTTQDDLFRAEVSKGQPASGPMKEVALYRDAMRLGWDLINNLFRHPYTRIEFIESDLGVSRNTATKYLDELAAAGFLAKHREGRNNYYINVELVDLLSGESK